MEVQRRRETVGLPQPRDVGPGGQGHGAAQNHAVLADEFLPVLGHDRLLTVDTRREDKAGSLGRVVHGLLNVLPGLYR